MGISRKEVLIIDDDADMRILLKKILEGVGLFVLEATTVTEGVKLLGERVPHLVILDMKVGDESGVKFLEQKREKREWNAVPVLMLSQSKDKNDVYKAVSLGAVDYITKPLNNALIIQKVRKAMAMDASFARVDFDAAKRPKVQLVVHSQIIKAGEGGFVLESPLKAIEAQDYSSIHGSHKSLAKPKIVVRAPIMDEMGVSKSVYTPISMKTRASVEAPGRYTMEFSFSGLTDKVISRIRSIIGAWRTS